MIGSTPTPTPMTTEEAAAIVLIDGLVLQFIEYARNLGDETTADWVWAQLQRYEKALPKLPDLSDSANEAQP